jgi:hypothetical protein
MDLSVSQQGLCCADLVSFFVIYGVRSDGSVASSNVVIVRVAENKG